MSSGSKWNSLHTAQSILTQLQLFQLRNTKYFMSPYNLSFHHNTLVQTQHASETLAQLQDVIRLCKLMETLN